MNKIYSTTPAFPTERGQTNTGITIRAKIASEQMAAILSSDGITPDGQLYMYDPAAAAAHAVSAADALIAELNKQPEKK